MSFNLFFNVFLFLWVGWLKTKPWLAWMGGMGVQEKVSLSTEAKEITLTFLLLITLSR
jgi:hypothetical protein